MAGPHHYDTVLFPGYEADNTLNPIIMQMELVVPEGLLNGFKANMTARRLFAQRPCYIKTQTEDGVPRPYVIVRKTPGLPTDGNRFIRAVTMTAAVREKEDGRFPFLAALYAAQQVCWRCSVAPVRIRLGFDGPFVSVFGREALVRYNTNIERLGKLCRADEIYRRTHGGIFNGPQGYRHLERQAKDRLETHRLWTGEAPKAASAATRDESRAAKRPDRAKARSESIHLWPR